MRGQVDARDSPSPCVLAQGLVELGAVVEVLRVEGAAQRRVAGRGWRRVATAVGQAAEDPVEDDEDRHLDEQRQARRPAG